VRASARDARDALASGLGAAAATGVAARFMSSSLQGLATETGSGTGTGNGSGAIVAGYMPMRSEIDPRLLMDRLAAAGSVLCLPDVVAEGTPLEFRRWTPYDPLDKGRYGIYVPSPAADVLVPDVVLVPMLAFDRGGHRMGYGGGYYDRTMARLRDQGDVLAVGLAFSGQVRDDLPVEPHDLRLDWIVTESAALPVTGL
jgi:5-formyltetrahydrofolate cyclo-ligase